MSVQASQSLRAMVFVTLGCNLLVPLRLHAQGTEVLDTKTLGERGFVLHSENGKWGSIRHVSGAGDINGDGLSDFLTMFFCSEPTEKHEGAVGLFYGKPAVAGAQGSLLNPADVSWARFRLRAELIRPYLTTLAAGNSVGDLDGDGYGDFATGALDLPTTDDGSTGVAYLVYGGPDIQGGHYLDEDVGATLRGTLFFASDPNLKTVGGTIKAAGDLNGDRDPDLVISAPYAPLQSRPGAGAVFLLLETRDLPTEVDLAQVGKTLKGVVIYGAVRFDDHLNPDQGDELGQSLAPAGDVNGDGYDDLLIGAPTPGGSDQVLVKRVILFYGSATPSSFIDLQDIEDGAEIESIAVFSLPWLAGGNFAEENFAGVGDLNHDGFDDLLLGATGFCCNPFTATRGKAFLIHGQPAPFHQIDLSAPPPTLVMTTFYGGEVGDRFGQSVASAGDINQDGIPDLFIGAPKTSRDGQIWVGQADVLYGKSDFGPEVKLDKPFDGISILGENTYDAFGETVAPAGDFNGDGAPDLLVSAYQLLTGGPDDVSKLYLIYGQGSGPAPLRVSSIEPAWGSVRGGTTVLIRGGGFRGTPRVLFGLSPSPRVELVSGSTLCVLSPPDAEPRLVDVSVEEDDETKTLKSAFEYTQNLPAIDLNALNDKGVVLQGSVGSWPGASIDMGDLTGDGIADLVVGSGLPEINSVVSIVTGRSDFPASVDLFAPLSGTSLVQLPVGGIPYAATVTVLGDIDDDGVQDLGVGAGGGIGYLLFGRTTFEETLDLETEVALGRAARITGRLPSASRYHPVFAPVGDVTGDGIADLALSFADGPNDLNGFTIGPGLAGEVVWIEGRKIWPAELDLGLNASAFAFARVRGSSSGLTMGTELKSVGDFNGDGHADLLVNSVPRPDSGGSAFLIYGGAALPAEARIDELVESGDAVELQIRDGFQHLLWFHVARAGDVNHDGLGDLLLGVEGGGMSQEGVTYVVFGSRDLQGKVEIVEAPAAPDSLVRIFGEGSLEQSGRPGPAGDFNADGYDDFLIGGPGFQDLAGEPGNVFLIFGGNSLPPEIHLRKVGGRGLKIAGRVVLGGAGSSVAASSGDLNGDGQPDFAFSEVGTPEIAGSVYAVFGAYGGQEFVRGDGNSDGKVDVSDAVFVLSYLLLGGEGPQCQKAADVNDSAKTDITDAIYLLAHLFLGGSAPPLPYPARGKDPTTDALTCLGF